MDRGKEVKHKKDRSLTLEQLSPILKQANKNANIINLQKGEGGEEATNPAKEQSLIHLGNEIQDFSDTAAIVSQLDLVICVDTAIAHLTGSLNIPCWVLLPYYGTDWRWMEDRDDSPWYPDTMRLFRQTKEGEWDGVIQNLVNALEKNIQ